MHLVSSVFEDKQFIPKRYSCQSEGVSPPLNWNDIPAETQSLALVVDDPDAPGGTYVHWLVWNISPESAGFVENDLPAETRQGKNSSGTIKYTPPCPPADTHRYFFKLYALDAKLDLPAGENKESLLQAMGNHIIDKAQLIGKYQKS